MSGTVSVARGLDADRDRYILNRSTGEQYGPPPAVASPFLGTDVLACRVWPGDELATLFTPTAAWLDATGVASYRITFAAADTSSLAPGLYRGQTTVTRGSRTGRVDEFRLQVLPAPGSGSLGLTFTTLADLLTYAPWVEDLQADDEQFAFTTEQQRATNFLIDALVNMWKWQGYHPQVGQPGFGASSMGFASSPPPSRWLRQLLVPLTPNSTPDASLPDRVIWGTPANPYRSTVSTALLLKPNVLEICSKWALSHVFRAQVGRNADREWRGLATLFAREANALFRATRFEVDVANPQTGWASITVDGGTTDLR